jgi:predicted peroxiredoxin
MLARDAMGGRMKFVYVVTTGTDDPTKASLPLHLAANGSVAVGHDTAVLLAGDATEMLLGDNLDQLQGIGVPPARELIAKLRDHSVPVYV